MDQPVRTTVGQLLASDVGLTVEVQCPGKPRGQYRGSAPAGDDQGSVTVRLRDDQGTRTVGAMDVTPVLVHR